MANQSLAAARQALRCGNLRESEQLLANPGAMEIEALALRNEILFLRGETERAFRLSTELLNRVA